MATLANIARWPIHVANWVMLGLILIATPYVATGSLFGVQIIAARTAQLLAVIGLAIAVGLNFVGATILFRRKVKLRRLCFEWCLIDSVFLVIFLLVLQGVVRFEWLKDWLNSMAQRVR